MFDPRSVAEAHQKALAWERQGRRGGGALTSLINQVKGASSNTNVSKDVSKLVVNEVAKTKVNNFKCYNCEEFGHKSNECPKPKKRVMVAEVEDEDAEVECSNSPQVEEEVELVSGDEGRNLMMRRSCLTSKQKEETS